MSECFNRDWHCYEVFFDCQTDGSGFWTDQKKIVHIYKVEIEIFEDGTFGELRTYFYPKEWDVYLLGLIYTDEKFLNDIRICLKSRLNLSDDAVRNLDYSEQGMQRNDYVSFDICSTFISEVV